MDFTPQVAFSPSENIAYRSTPDGWVQTDATVDKKTGEVSIFDGSDWIAFGQHPDLERALKSAEPQAPQQRPSGLLAQAAEGARDAAKSILGAPVDAANSLLSIVGAGSETPVLGSKHLEQILPRNALPPDAPKTLLESIARGAPGAIAQGVMIPATAGAVATIPGIGALPKAVLEALGQGSAIGNAALGLAGDVGGKIAENVAPEPYKGAANVAGNIGGTVLAAASPALLNRAIESVKFPLTPGAAQAEVANIIAQRAGVTPQELSQFLATAIENAPDGVPLNTVELLAGSGLSEEAKSNLASVLQQVRRSNDGGGAARLAAIETAVKDAMAEKLEGLKSQTSKPSDLVSAIERDAAAQRNEQLALREAAQQELASASEQLPQNISVGESRNDLRSSISSANQSARSTFSDDFDKLRELEKQWTVSPKPYKQAFDDVAKDSNLTAVEKRQLASSPEFNSVLADFKALGKKTNIAEISSIITKIGEDVRRLRTSDSKSFAATILERLKTKLETLRVEADEVSLPPGSAPEGIQEFSKALRARYRDYKNTYDVKGTPTRDIRRFDVTGRPIIPDEVVIDKLIARPTDIREAVRVLGPEPAVEKLSNGIIAELRDFAARDGTINARKWDAWMNQRHRQLKELDRIAKENNLQGDLYERLRRVSSAQAELDNLPEVPPLSSRDYNNKAAKLLLDGAEPKKVVGAALESDDPARDITKMLTAIKGDADALAALRTAAVEHLQDKFAIAATTESGAQQLSGARLMKYLSVNGNKLKLLFDNAQLGTLNEIAKTQDMIERSSRILAKGSPTAQLTEAMQSERAFREALSGGRVQNFANILGLALAGGAGEMLNSVLGGALTSGVAGLGAIGAARVLKDATANQLNRAMVEIIANPRAAREALNKIPKTGRFTFSADSALSKALTSAGIAFNERGK